VLVLATTGAPAAGRRRRRRNARSGAEEKPLPLTRATAVRAFEPFESEPEAAAWLQASEVSETEDVLVEEGIALLNRALHAQRVAAGDPGVHELVPERAVAARLGYGSGDQVADGRAAATRELDLDRGARRRRRARQDLRPQERVAAVLGGRETVDACETLVLRARADIDARRWREAALQLRVGLEALLVELRGALRDPAHEEDMAVLEARRHEVGQAANAALRGELEAEARDGVRELVELCERVLRRRRLLRG
jgi:hypothetical protein